MIVPLLVLAPIAVLLLAIAAATVRQVWSSRTSRRDSQSQRKDASMPYGDSSSSPTAASAPPLRRSLSEVINEEEEEQRAEQQPNPYSLNATPFQQRDNVGISQSSRTSVVVHSPVSAASPTLPHPPPSPFLWTRPPAFSPQYSSNGLPTPAAAPTPASRRSLPPLPSSAATIASSKPADTPAASAAVLPSRKRGASPHVISLSDAIGLSQPDKRSRRARTRDMDEDDIEMADGNAYRRAKRKETRHSREDGEEAEDSMVDLGEEAADHTANKSSKRRNVLASPATQRRQTVSENELRRRKRTGRDENETIKRPRTIATDDELDEREEMDEEAEEDEEHIANGSDKADSLAVDIDSSAVVELERSTEANESAAPMPRPPPTPSHLLPLAPSSPYLPSASTALLDPRVRRKSGRAVFKTRHSLPAPTVMNASWVRDEDEEETEEEKEREDKVTKMLEQGLHRGRRRADIGGATAYSKLQQQQEEQKAESGLINGPSTAVSTSSAGFPQQNSSSTSLPSFDFTSSSMSSQPSTALSSMAGAAPTFPFNVNAPSNSAMPAFSNSATLPSNSNSNPAPFNFNPSQQQQQQQQQQPINQQQSTQFPSTNQTNAPFNFPTNSFSSQPQPQPGTGTSFPGFAGAGMYGGPSMSQGSFNTLSAPQPLQAQSSGGMGGDGGGSGFRAPSRSGQRGKGRTGGRR